jgi:hypothetical protein
VTLPSHIRTGRRLIAAAAWSTLIVPILVDAVLMPEAHMSNPLWLPHAKLHTAMSFFGAVGLGVGALLLLRIGDPRDIRQNALAAFLATAFWIGLIGAGFWPGTSYAFADDPVAYVAPPVVAGVPVHMNVVLATLSILAGWTGVLLARPAAPAARAIT